VAWIFALWSQCCAAEDASAFAAHFEHQRWTLSDGTAMACSASIMAGTCCWIAPTNVSRSGVSDQAVAAQLTEAGAHLYAHLRAAPAFRFAMVGVEVDDVRSEFEVEEMVRASHRAYQGLVVAADLWQRAGQPSLFQPFRPGYVWRPYLGEFAAG
jgi:hypothetical protein